MIKSLLFILLALVAVSSQSTEDLTTWSHFAQVFPFALSSSISNQATLSQAVAHDNEFSSNAKSFGCATYSNAEAIGKKIKFKFKFIILF